MEKYLRIIIGLLFIRVCQSFYIISKCNDLDDDEDDLEEEFFDEDL